MDAADQKEGRVESDPSEKVGIEAVEDAPVTGERRSGILDASVTLQRRLDEVPELSGDARKSADEGTLPRREVADRPVKREGNADADRRRRSAEGTLHRLAR